MSFAAKTALNPLLGAALLAAAATANASPVTLLFTGNTYQIFDYGSFVRENDVTNPGVDLGPYFLSAMPGTSIVLNGAFTGRLTYDTAATFTGSTVDSAPYIPATNYFYQTPLHIDVTFGSGSNAQQVSYSGNAEIRLRDDQSGYAVLSDQIDFTIDPSIALDTSPDLPGWAVTIFDKIQLNYAAGFDFSGNPPTLAQNINASGLAPGASSLSLQYQRDGETYLAYNYFTSVQTVPTPSAFVLLGSALTGLAGLKHKRRSRK